MKKRAGPDIRNHRFVPEMDTSSKVFTSKKQKSKTRRELNKKARKEAEDESYS